LKDGGAIEEGDEFLDRTSESNSVDNNVAHSKKAASAKKILSQAYYLIERLEYS
jgi:hypothetical protein